MSSKLYRKYLFLLSITVGVSIYFIVPPVFAGQMIEWIHGSISLGATATSRFMVDKTSRLHVFGSGVGLPFQPDVQFKLIFVTPAGKRIDPFDQPGDPSFVVKQVVSKGKGKGETIRTLDILNPAAGYWTAEISLVKGGNKFQNYELVISCDDCEITFRPVIKNGLVALGTPTLIEVELLKSGQRYSDPKVFFVMQMMEMPLTAGNVPKDFSYKFLDDGTSGDRIASDGIYSTIWTPDVSGRYILEIDAISPGSFQRTDSLIVDVSAQAARLTEVIKEELIDKDRNGKFEALKFIVGVEVSTAVKETYEVEATLSDRTHHLIGIEQNLPPETQVGMPIVFAEIPATPGVHEVSFFFPGEFFLSTKADGPYVADIKISNQELWGRMLDQLAKPYQTKAYRWQDFEPGQK